MNKESNISVLIRGERESAIPCVHADLPTDPIKVVNAIKNDFIETPSFRVQFVNAIKQMANELEYSWFSLYYLYSIIRIINANNLDVDIEGVVLEIEDSLKKHEGKLRLEKKWGGVNYKNGLWGDVERISKNIFEEFGVKIYPYKD